jgi:peptide/nickel transport system ATP-binding protein
MPALLEVENLTIAFPALTPVLDLSFSIDAGETLALVGESGSGKSLTALSLLRLLPEDARVRADALRFDGRDLDGLTAREFRRLRGGEIGMVFQEPMTALNPVLTVGEQIAEALRAHEKLSAKAAKARAIELLAHVRISDPHLRYHEYPHRLSGGMRQRVGIAIAVACSPKLLIADEPTTALDVTIQAQLMELIDSLRRELGMALLLITHDLGLVAEWADRVVVLYAGRKVEEAAADNLFAAPAHPYTRGLLAASPRLIANRHYTLGRLDEIPGGITSAAGEPGCAFYPRCALRRSACRVRPPDLAGVADNHLAACLVTTALVTGGSHGVLAG